MDVKNEEGIKKRGRIATTSVRTGFAMTWWGGFQQEDEADSKRRVWGCGLPRPFEPRNDMGAWMRIATASLRTGLAMTAVGGVVRSRVGGFNSGRSGFAAGYRNQNQRVGLAESRFPFGSQ